VIAAPTYADVLRAAHRTGRYVHRTPVFTCASLDRMTEAGLFFKCENLQKVGAFKFRGALNAVLSLSEADAARGVATHSSGNHAQALALAARVRGISAHVVMPTTTTAVKRRAVEDYGARIIDCEPTLEARERALEQVVEETGAIFVHPYDDPRVIAGQGTATLELLEQVPEVEAVIAPIGGGGLLAGTTLAARGARPNVSVWGAEPAAADDAARSLAAGVRLPAGDPITVADGLRTSIGVHPFAILHAAQVPILTVGEEAIVAAMRHVWERTKLVVEPSAAVPVAALLEPDSPLRGKRVGVILSGGNVDLDRLPWQNAAG